MLAAIPKELQQAINAAAFPIMAKLKLKGPVVITIDPPPAPPAGLSAVASLGGIALRWTANTETDLAPLPYRVYRGASLIAGPQSGTTFTDSTARAGQQYTYEVTATDAGGNESAPASTTATRPAPPAVTSLVATPTAGHDVALSWQASVDPAHAGYPLYRSASGGAFALLATPTLTNYTDIAPAQNVPLVYRVLDQNAVGDVGPNADVSTLIDTAAPAALANLRITGVTSTSIALAWDASAASDLAGYKVERSVNGATFTVLAALQIPTTYTDNGVSSGFPYTYRVTAIDTSNNASQPATITASIPTPPAAPANLTATGSTSGIALAWNAVSGAVGYRVASAPAATGPFTTIASPTGTSYSDSAAIAGVTTFYRVWAVDSLGQAGAVATTSAVRSVVVGTSYPQVGVGASAQRTATATAPKLGHFTHFSARHLVPVGVDWKDCRFQWDLGEPGTQTVIDPRDGVTVVDISRDGHADALMLYTTAGQKNVSVTITTPAGGVATFGCVVNVPPSNRVIGLVGPTRTYKTFADISAHAADNTDWVIDAGSYDCTVDVRLRSNMVIRAATPGAVTLHSKMVGTPIFTCWPGQTKDATVSGINFDSDYVNATNGDGTPIRKSSSSIVTEKGENVGFADCTVAVMNECWKGSEVDLSKNPPTSFLNGSAHLRCGATDPIGVYGRTFWIEGIDYKMIGCWTLNSMSESPERNANTAAIRAYRAWNNPQQTADPANHRPAGGFKAASTNRALRSSLTRCCKIGPGDNSFDPHTGDANNIDNLVDACLIYGQTTIQGNNFHLRLTNNVMDRRGGNGTGIYLSFNGNLPIDSLEIVNNTMLGDSPHQPMLYVGSYTGSQFTNFAFVNNLNVNPALVPIAGNAYGSSMVFSNQDTAAVIAFAGNVHPNVLDWRGGKKLIYVGLTTLSPDYMLTLAQFNTLYGATDVQQAVTLNSGFAPSMIASPASVGGVVSQPAVNVPLLDYRGTSRTANSVGAANPA